MEALALRDRGLDVEELSASSSPATSATTSASPASACPRAPTATSPAGQTTSARSPTTSRAGALAAAPARARGRQRGQRRHHGARHEVSMPVLVAPVAIQRMAHDDGEAGMARAAAAAGTIMVRLLARDHQPRPTWRPRAPDSPRWFQVYRFRDSGVTQALIDQATDAGYRRARADRRCAARSAAASATCAPASPCPAEVDGARASRPPRAERPAGPRPTLRADGRLGHLARPRGARRLDRPAGAGEGRHDRRGRASSPASTAPPAWSSRTTAGGSSTASGRRSTRCPRSPRRSRAAPRCWWTAGCAGERTP